MKKTATVLIIISLISAILFGCVQKNVDKEVVVEFGELTVFEVEHNTDEGNHNYDYDPWVPERLSFEDKSAKSKFTVEFNGVKYTGEYSESWISCPNSYVTHSYNGDGVWFAINADSGILTELTVLKKNTPSEKFDQSKCREFADKIAGKYIELSKYAVDVKENSDSGNCRYRYTKEVDGYATAEYLSITVDSEGNVISFYTRMLNYFNSVVNVMYDEEKALNAIESKLSSIYEGVDTYESYSIKDVYLTKLKDGSFGFVYNIVCELKKIDLGNGTYTTPSTLITLLIKGSTTRPAE